MKNINAFKSNPESRDARAILEWALGKFTPKRLLLASSFSIEDQVLTHLLSGLEAKARVFTLDTGRLFEETHAVMRATMERYELAIEVYAPFETDVEALVSDGGPDLFYESVEKRKKCCEVRKVRPLKFALSSADAWICGLRREQSQTRTELEAVEWDEGNGLFKINPLFNWTEKDVWQFIRENNVPYNKLYDEGFRSVGCAPCTRAVREGEDVRAGRWWWESPEHKECGLHKSPVKGKGA